MFRVLPKRKVMEYSLFSNIRWERMKMKVFTDKLNYEAFKWKIICKEINYFYDVGYFNYDYSFNFFRIVSEHDFKIVHRQTKLVFRLL